MWSNQKIEVSIFPVDDRYVAQTFDVEPPIKCFAETRMSALFLLEETLLAREKSESSQFSPKE